MAQAPGRLRCPREYLLRWDEPQPLATSAGDLEGRHDLGDREGVVKENPRDIALLRFPTDAAPLQPSFPLEQLRAVVPQGIDERLRASGVPVELCGRAVKVVVMEEELQAPERRLPAPSGERDDVGRAEEPVTVDGSDDLKIAGRKHHGADRRALEALPTGLNFKHQVSVPAS